MWILAQHTRRSGFLSLLRRNAPYATRCTCYRQEALVADNNNRNAEESESGSVGRGVFCLDCGQATANLLPLAHQTQCSECDGGFGENVLVRVLSSLHLLRMLDQWRTGCLGNTPTHPALSPIPLSTGRWSGEGRWVGRMGTHLPAWSSAATRLRAGHERWRSGVGGRGGVVGRYVKLSEFFL